MQTRKQIVRAEESCDSKRSYVSKKICNSKRSSSSKLQHDPEAAELFEVRCDDVDSSGPGSSISGIDRLARWSAELHVRRCECCPLVESFLIPHASMIPPEECKCELQQFCGGVGEERAGDRAKFGRSLVSVIFDYRVGAAASLSVIGIAAFDYQVVSCYSHQIFQSACRLFEVVAASEIA
eukprot:746136-Hanusia_phi.AAC.2